MVDPAEMNEYSRRFAERLFERYPACRELATEEAPPQLDRGAFDVEVPSPLDPSVVLWITTVGGEVTIGLGASGYHEHHSPWNGGEAVSMAEALDAIDDILQGTTRVAECVEQGVFKWWKALGPGEEPGSRPCTGCVEILSWPGGRFRGNAA